MASAKYLLVAVSVLFSVCEVSGDNSVPTKCDPPCQQVPPPDPPLSGNPSSGNPTPPPPSSYSIYGAPPPPADKKSDPKKCPPASPQVQCCNPPYPYYTYAPPNTYTYAPPNTYPYAPPSPYTYMPYGEGGKLLVPILAPLMMIFSSSFFFLF